MRIGFFDSGAGGISVLKECINALPYADYIYFADNGNAPYGNKSQQTICRNVFNAVSVLEGYNINCLVIACNTATSACIEELRECKPYKVIGIEPAVLPAVKQIGGKILLLCTEATARQPKLSCLLKTLPAQIDVMPMPTLATLIEHNLANLQLINAELRQLLAQFKNSGYSCVVLGCTHYSLIKNQIEDIMQLQAFDGDKGVANNLRKTALQLNCTECPQPQKTKVEFIFTSYNLQQLYEELLR